MYDPVEVDAPISLGIVLYPGFKLLDVAGPQFALGLHGETQMFWKSIEPVSSDTGPSLMPTTRFSDFEGQLDVLMVPGGFGVDDAMHDEDVMEFVIQTSKSARYVAGVCSGSILLASAGQLTGRRATSHWLFHEMLQPRGAIPVNERVVKDGNRYTCGGGTAGIDFGLRLLAELRGDQIGRATELGMEYDPEPPFKTGNPRDASPELVDLARDIAVKLLFDRPWAREQLR
jgi:cyclohexyl-isocyanide hydratase